MVVDRIIDPALAAGALARYEELFAGHFETGLYPDEWNWRPTRDAPDLTRQICNGWKSDRAVAQGRPATRHRQGVCPPGRLARQPVEPGQRLVETAGRQASRIPPGLELRTVGGPPGLGELLDRPRGHHGGGWHRGVRPWIAPVATVGNDRGIPRAHRPATRAPRSRGRGRRGTRARAGGGASRWRCLPLRVDMARIRGQPDHRPAPFSGGPLHVVGDALSPRHGRLPLQPLQAVRRRHHGRDVLSHHVA